MRMIWLTALLLLPASAEVLFEDGFESLDARWRQDLGTTGEGDIAIVDGGAVGRCLRIRSEGRLVYLTCTLDAAALRGRTIVVSGLVKLDGVRQGAQVFSTPKFHFGYRRAGSPETLNAADRWSGSFDWTPKRLELAVPDDCASLELDIGNQNGFGTFYVDSLKLETVGGAARPLNLLPACNTGRSDGVADDGRGSFIDTGALDLHQLPDGPLTAGDWTFGIAKPGDNGGRVMIALRGRRRPNLPERTEAVELQARVGRLALVTAAAFVDQPREPVLRVRLTYADGQEAEWLLRAMTDIGAFDSPEAGEAWPLIWTGRCGAGTAVGVGLGEWTNPRPEVPIAGLVLESAGGAVPLVLAGAWLPPGP